MKKYFSHKNCSFIFLLLSLLLIHWILLPNSLSKNYFGRSVIVIGKINGIPTENKLGTQFLMNIETLQGKKYRGKLHVNWYQRRHVMVHPGERWRLILKLKPIHGLHNPGGFNFERYAKMEGIIASGYVVPHVPAKRLSSPVFSIDKFRWRIEKNIQKNISSETLRGIIDALTIGSNNLLTKETWLVFQRTGTSHLMAISGMNVAFVAGIIYFLLNWFLRCFPWVLLRFPAQRLAAIGSTFIAWVYGFLVGFSLPTQRALIMITVVMFSSLFFQRISIWKSLGFAFLIILAWQPLALFSVSFWLSFMAVFWIAYAALGKKSWWRVNLLIDVGLLPIILYCFHQVPLISFLSNLIAIPWISILIAPLCLLASVVFLFSNAVASWIWCVAAKCLFPLWFLLSYISQWGQWLHPINDIFLMLCALLGVFLLAAPRGFVLRPLGILLIFPLFFVFPPHPKKNTVELTVLDVGQGLSAVIQTKNHVLIYDTGPKFVTGFDAGQSVLVPFLQIQGIHKVDTLVVSHGDNDHIGGSFWLMDHYPVAHIFSSIPRSPWHRSYTSCLAGQAWEWDGVHFQFLWPPPQQDYQDNNSSCVLRVSVGQQAILLTGDIEKPVEESLLANPSALASSILVAPHHGSRSSSTQAFVQAVHPKVVIMSVGFQNRYHFPAPSVISRYESIGAQIISTSERGAVRLMLGIEGIIGDNEHLNG